jgi:uncharacterized alpha-E superfamily protein
MLSRVANSIYWMSRYIERAENTARFIDVVRHLVLDLPTEDANHWESLIFASGDAEGFEERYGTPDEAGVMQFLTFDRQNPNSILSSMYMARENARTIREVISSEMWEQINRSYLMVREAQQSDRLADDPAAFFSHFKKACHLFVGITDITMTHNTAWHFVRMGRLLERADKTSRAIDVKYFMLLPNVEYVGSPYDSLQWGALLKSISALEMYRKLYHQFLPKQVVAFLVLHPEFPRSVHYCLIKAEDSLHAITGTRPSRFSNKPEQLLGRLRSELNFTDTDDIFNYGLHEFLDTFQAKLNNVGTAIHEKFFAIRED